MGENVGGQERVSARREEVIVNTDLFNLEDLCPVLGQQLLERRPWRDEGPREGCAVRHTQFSRQADTLHFTGMAFRYFRDDEYLARDLEVRDAPSGELTNVFHRCHSVRPQHDGRRDILPQRGMRDGKGHGLCHRRVFQEYFVNFLRSEFLPAAIY